jgi:hypothetical protein
MEKCYDLPAIHFIEATPQLDRRRSQRVTAKLRAVLSTRGRFLRARHKALIVDYSILGLRVQAEAGLTSGQVVRIASEMNPAQPAACQVAWVGRVGSPKEGEAGLVFLDLVS